MTKMKAILKVNVQNEKDKKKAMTIVSKIGVDLIWMDMEEKKMTIIGDVDIYGVMTKLKQHYTTDLLQYTDPVEPTLEPQKLVGKKSGSLKILVNYDGDKKIAMQIAIKAGVDFISMHMVMQEMRIMGDVSIHDVVTKLKKRYDTDYQDSTRPVTAQPKRPKPVCVIL